jgi:hypothetical protein
MLIFEEMEMLITLNLYNKKRMPTGWSLEDSGAGAVIRGIGLPLGCHW